MNKYDNKELITIMVDYMFKKSEIELYRGYTMRRKIKNTEYIIKLHKYSRNHPLSQYQMEELNKIIKKCYKIHDGYDCFIGLRRRIFMGDYYIYFVKFIDTFD